MQSPHESGGLSVSLTLPHELPGDEDARDHTPEEYRDLMIENVPLNRDVMAAWKKCQGAD